MVLYIVVPCYNEQEVLPETAKRLNEKLNGLKCEKKISDKSRIVFVNDGSKDDTREIINRLCGENKNFCGITLSRNCGHQNALIAGLDYAAERCDAAVSIDADLQDDINAIDQMIEKYQSGCEIVYGVRKSRKKDSFFKRNSALFFYKLLKFFGVEAVYNHADYRLMSKNALTALRNFNEVNLFLRGIVPLVGFKSDIVYYDRDRRFAGESKYPLKKMISFGLEGITSFSIKPIRMIFSAGLVMLAVSLIMLIYALVSYFSGHITSGWTSLILSVWAIGGLQMVSIGIIGEYIGKVYLETKRRPRYIIEEIKD